MRTSLLINSGLISDFSCLFHTNVIFLILWQYQKSPVWEISGAEFSRAGSHTAGIDSSTSEGISIRFPRVTKIRSDKSWKESTSVDRLKVIMAASKSQSDWSKKLNDISDVVTTPSKRSAGSRRPSTPSTSNKHVSPTKVSYYFILVIVFSYFFHGLLSNNQNVKDNTAVVEVTL